MSPALRCSCLKLKAQTLLVFARSQAALGVFETMLQLWPHDGYALASSAHLMAAQGNFAGSVARLRQLVKVTPGTASAWFNLGYVHQQAGQHVAAEAVFHKAVALDPAMDRAWYGLGLALMHRRQFDEAAVALQKAAALQPMSPHAWYRLVEVWVALNKADKAREVLQHLKQFEPRVAAQLERQACLHNPLSAAPHAAP